MSATLADEPWCLTRKSFFALKQWKKYWSSCGCRSRMRRDVRSEKLGHGTHLVIKRPLELVVLAMQSPIEKDAVFCVELEGVVEQLFVHLRQHPPSAKRGPWQSSGAAHIDARVRSNVCGDAGRAGRPGEVAHAVASEELFAERVLRWIGTCSVSGALFARRDKSLQHTWFALSRLEWLTDDAPSSLAAGALSLVFDSGPRLSVKAMLRSSVEGGAA